MEKAKLEIRKSKKGKIIVTVHFDNGKKMPVQNINIPEEYNDRECMAERNKNGQIETIQVDGKTFASNTKKVPFRKPVNHQGYGSKNRTKHPQASTVDEPRLPAKAPYNFIPLNEQVIEAPSVPDFGRYHDHRLSGYIDLNITTKTPVYIRRVKGKDEENISYEEIEFFKIGDTYKIPGSSLRGMTRNLIEIVTYSKFRFFDDTRLYFRELADVTRLRKVYTAKMAATQDSNSKTKKYKQNAGYLNYDADKDAYYIIPATGFQAVKDTKKTIERQFAYERHPDGSVEVWPGGMKNKKHHWLVGPPNLNAKKVNLSESDIKDYEGDKNRKLEKEKDKNRKLEIDILKIARQKKSENTALPDGVPVFYTRYSVGNTKHVAFGHTVFFRLPYELTIGAHVPEQLKTGPTDFAEAIFGKIADKNEDSWAGRVFFEDAEILPGQNNVELSITRLQALSSPKPTTFQHYLKQPQGVKTAKHDMQTWDDPESIRGHKLYWHRRTPRDGKYGWHNTKEKQEKVSTEAKPIREGVRFAGRIRFENLSKEELGALLFVLELPENHYHKIGMAKPLGLGSVEIRPTLHIINRNARYTRLFEGNKWFTADTKQDTKGFKKTFEDYMLKKLGIKTGSLWKVTRLKQLKHMLNWENTKQIGWLEKTRYMEIERQGKSGRLCSEQQANKEKCNKFSQRYVLPEPSEVVKL